MKEKIMMIVFVLVLGTLLTSALLAVNYYTAPRIERNRMIKVKSSILKAFNIRYSRDEVETIFSENIKVIEKEGKKFYISKDGVIAFNISGSGLWGPIKGIFALEEDLRTVAGLTLVQQEETPGLGGRIGEKEFLERFKGKTFVPEIKIVAPGKAKKENEVDGITAATMTCEAFQVLINNEVKKGLDIYRRNR